MQQDQPNPNKLTPLRQRAEEAAQDQLVDIAKLSTDDIQHLVHELQVHQIELEMQNENLRRAQEQVEESRDKYADLYDFAPGGYFAVAEKGLILEANLTGATMLGLDRNHLLKQPFSRFVAWDDEDTLYLHRKQVFKTKTAQVCDLKMVKKDGAQFDARLESIAVRDSEGNYSHFRVAVSDITERMQAEEALRESEERFRALIENASDVITILDDDGIIRYESPSIEQVLGYKPEELIGRKIFEIIHPEDMPNMMDNFTYGLQNPGVSLSMEGRVRHKDGSWRLFEATGKNLLDNPIVAGIVINSRDVTERKQVEETLRESEESLAMAQQIAHIGSWDWHIQDDKLTWSDETYRHFGLKPQEISPTYEDFEGFVHPDDRGLVNQVVEQALNEKKPYSVEARMIRVDGTEWIMHAQGTTYRDKDGKAVRFVGTQYDITERRQAEEELRIQANIINSASSAIATTDLDGKMTSYNPIFLKMWGFDETDQIVGRPFSEFWLVSGQLDEIMQALLEQENWTGEIKAKKKDGSLFDVQVSAATVYNQAGQLIRLMSSSVDITDRKQAEEAIRKSEKLLKESQEAAKIGSWILNLVSNELEWSEKTYNLFDQDRNTFTPSFDEFARLVHPDDFETMQTQFNAALESDDHPYHVVIRIINDSEREWVMEAFGAVSRDKHGNPIRIAGTAQDVTERKRAEETLRESENRITNFFNLSADLICIADINGYFRLLNPAWEKVLGYSMSELTSKPFLDFVHSDDVEKTLAVINEKLERGESILTFENRYVCKDGSIIWLDWTSQPSVEEGQVFAIARDITERKRDEEERERLLAAEREQRLLAETLYEVTLALTSQTSHHQAVLDEILRQTQRLVPYNAANIVLLDAVHNTLRIACRQGYETFGSEELVSNLVQSLADFPLDAEVIRSQKSLVIPDVHQEPRWVTFKESAWIKSHIVVPICHRNRVLGLLRLDSDTPGQFFPIDAERLQPLANAAAIALENARLYDQALQDARIKTELLKEVNHRVKNNLMAISGLFQAEKHHASAEAQAPVAAAMTRLNRHLQGLAEVHSILSQSEWGPVLLSNLVDRIIHLALKPLLTNDQQVQVEVAQSSIEVSPRQAGNLTLVINELATNTAKHTLLPDAGQATIRITVSLALDGDMIRIEYRDNGPGYPAKVLSLGRDDVTGPQSPGKAGLSVGLYLTRRIVAGTLRGRLSLTNNNGAVTTIQFKTEERNTT